MQCINCALSYEGEYPTNKRAMSRTCLGKKARLKMVDYFCYNVLNAPSNFQWKCLILTLFYFISFQLFFWVGSIL